MKRIVLLIALLVASGAVADTLSTEADIGPEVQVAETVEADPAVDAAQTDKAPSCQPATETEQTFEVKKSDCPFGAPSCTPFNLEPCEDYCGAGFGDCYRWCCVCTG